MTLLIDLVAAEGQRLFSRVLQVLETQRTAIQTFSGEVRDGEVLISVAVTTDPSRVDRIEALLNRLESVRNVACRAVVPVESATSEDDLLAPKWGNALSPEP